MMGTNLKVKLAAGAAALVAVTGGGAAIAASKASPAQESKATVADAAQQLGISSDRLTAALKSALGHRIDAALAAGEITAAQATQMKADLASGNVPLLGFGRGGPGGHGGRHGGPGLETASTYLGITEAALRTKLEAGSTLADLATATSGKSVDGLVAALVKAAKAHLAQEVADGRITQAQADARTTGLEARVAAMVATAGFGPHGGERAPDAPPAA